MKKFILLLGFFSFAIVCLAQTTFSPQQIISNDANGVRDLAFADINDDGYDDIVAALFDDNTAVWYDNDGTGVFGAHHLISNNIQGALFVNANDFTGDGIPDVVAISDNDNKIAWFENDGIGSFGDEIVLQGNVEDARSLIAVDLDGDTDCDILVGTETKIFWYKNNGNGGFGPQTLIAYITGNYIPQWTIAVGDLDNDNDLDIVSGCLTNIYWYENIGSCAYDFKQLLYNYGSEVTKSLQTNDIDKDGDIDVLAGLINWPSSSLKWYENNLTLFNEINVIPYCSGESTIAIALELDGDNLTDILATSYTYTESGQVYWLKNTGYENFTEPMPIESGIDLSGLFANDLDNDNDQDVICFSNLNNRIFSYENQVNSITHVDYPLCENDSILIGNVWITELGSYPFDTLLGVYGGDSILIYNLYSHTNPEEFQITGPVEAEEYEIITYSVPSNPAVEYSFEVENGNILSTQTNSVEIQWQVNSIGIIKAYATFPETTCDAESFLEVTVGTGDINEYYNNEVQLYPNPANDVLFVDTEFTNICIELINSSGQVVKTSSLKKINISSLESNIYFVKVYDKHGSLIKTQKLIVSR